MWSKHSKHSYEQNDGGNLYRPIGHAHSLEPVMRGRMCHRTGCDTYMDSNRDLCCDMTAQGVTVLMCSSWLWHLYDRI